MTFEGVRTKIGFSAILSLVPSAYAFLPQTVMLSTIEQKTFLLRTYSKENLATQIES